MTKEIGQVLASSRQLSSADADPDAEVEGLRSLVHAERPAFTVLRIGERDLRRIDVWARDDAVGVVPHNDDPDVEVPCGYGTGPAGTVLLLELLADPTASGTDDLGPRRFADVDELVQRVTSADDGLTHAAVLHDHSTGSDLVRGVGRGVWWGSATTGEMLELTAAGDAAYWATVLQLLRG